jgi:lysophospholipase L1-like esterase
MSWPGPAEISAPLQTRIWAYVTLLAISTLGFSMSDLAQAGSSPTPVSSMPMIIIIGASYAAGWKSPAIEGHVVVNRGVGGEETSQMSARFQRDVVAQRPAAVLIWGHINNLHRAPNGDLRAAELLAQSDYTRMVEMARSAGIEVWLATEVTLSEAVTWPDRAVALLNRVRGRHGYNARVNDHVRSLNAWLRDFAAQKRVRLIDLELALDGGRGFRRVEYSDADGSHISPAGYAALTVFLRARLQ